MLRLLTTLLLSLALSSSAYAGVNNITEEDGSPSNFPWKLKFPNASLTDNGDGSVSVAFSAAAETNSLETLTTGILSTEIPIGTAANTVVYAALSGNATMTNAGVVTVNDLTCTDCIGTTEISDVYVQISSDEMTGDLGFTDDRYIYMGVAADFQMTWETTGNDHFELDVAAEASAARSGYLILTPTSSPYTLALSDDDPHFMIVSGDGVDYIDIYNDRTNGVIEVSSGALNLNAPTITQTAAADDNDTSVATTAYVQTEIAALGGKGLTVTTGVINSDGYVIGGATGASHTTTYYVGLFGTGGNNTEGIVATTRAPISGTLKFLHYETNAAPDNGAGTQTWTVLLSIAGVDSGVTCVVSEAELVCSDVTNSIAVAQGQTILLQATAANTPTTTNGSGWTAVIVPD